METVSRLPAAESGSSRLLLVYGTKIPYGVTQEWIDTYAGNGEWDVVRMAFFAESDRALIGGDPGSEWVRHFCRRLADSGTVTMVLGVQEAEEAIRQLPRYLAWKERFYVELGETCDRQCVSLQRVARALGMDKRIGQGWQYPGRADHRQIRQWIERECQHVLGKTNVQRIVLWGPLDFWMQMDHGWLAEKEVCVYAGQDKPFPKEWSSAWSSCPNWTDALENADLLVIAQADGVVEQIPLPELIRPMKQAIVVDAGACFPLAEAQAFVLCYRAIGEKTNVWE